MVLLILRAFACRLRGAHRVEAISNGVPAFRAPKIRNAQAHAHGDGPHRHHPVRRPGARAALITGVHYAEDACRPDRLHELRDRTPAQPRRADRQRHVRRRQRRASRSSSSRGRPRSCCCSPRTPPSTASRCSARVLAKDGYAPKAMSTRGDRLIFSNGVHRPGHRGDHRS